MTAIGGKRAGQAMGALAIFSVVQLAGAFAAVLLFRSGTEILMA